MSEIEGNLGGVEEAASSVGVGDGACVPAAAVAGLQVRIKLIKS